MEKCCRCIDAEKRDLVDSRISQLSRQQQQNDDSKEWTMIMIKFRVIDTLILMVFMFHYGFFSVIICKGSKCGLNKSVFSDSNTPPWADLLALEAM